MLRISFGDESSMNIFLEALTRANYIRRTHIYRGKGFTSEQSILFNLTQVSRFVHATSVHEEGC